MKAVALLVASTVIGAGAASAQTQFSLTPPTIGGNINIPNYCLLNGNGTSLGGTLPDASLFCNSGTLGLSGTVLTNLTMESATNSVIASSTVLGGPGNLILQAPGFIRLQMDGSTIGLQSDSSGVTTGMPLLINAPTVISNTYGREISENLTSLTGGVTSGYTNPTYLNLIQIANDSANAAGFSTCPGSGLSACPQNLVALQISHSFGGSTMTGGRDGLVVATSLSATSGNTTYGTSFAAMTSYATAYVNDGGTSGAGNGNGTFWSLNTIAALRPASVSAPIYWGEMDGYEMDVYAPQYSSVGYKYGLKISLTNGDVVQGSLQDAAISFGNNLGAGTWKNIIQIGGYGYNAPSDTNTVFLSAQNAFGGTLTAGTGIDWHLVTFSGNAYTDGHNTFAGDGSALLNSATALATSATTGFVHLPHTPGVPTGTPGNTTPGCEWNTVSHTLNCYDGSSWYHFTGTSGAN